MTNKEEKNQFSVMTSLKMVKIRLSKKKMNENNKSQNFILKNIEKNRRNDTYTIEK